jgi:uncharacterized protein YukE
MPGPIRYEFGTLGDGQTQMAGCATEVDQLNADWKKAVNAVIQTWLDSAGFKYEELHQMWDSAANSNREFQTNLAMALGQAKMNGENALQQCMTII